MKEVVTETNKTRYSTYLRSYGLSAKSSRSSWAKHETQHLVVKTHNPLKKDIQGRSLNSKQK